VGNLQAADAFLEYAVRDTLDALGLGDEDLAARQLAIRYARAIDTQVGSLWHLGPELLKTLAELGATPAARARIKNMTKSGEKPDAAPASRIDQLRTARAAHRPAGA
jgi:hypothetical protein